MAKKPDTPCAGGCGKLLWTGPRSKPAGERYCRDCKGAPAPASAPVPEPEPVTPALGRQLGERGRRLWDDTIAGRSDLAPAELVLLEEACRTADRLDRLDDLLTGRQDAWLRLRAANEAGTVLRVVVDRALSEVRQQQEAFRGMVADLLKKQPAAAPEKPEGSRRDELARRREERRRSAGL